MQELIQSIEERIAVFKDYKPSASMTCSDVINLLEQIKKDAEQSSIKDVCNKAGFFAEQAKMTTKWYWFNDKLEKLSEGYFSSEDEAYLDALAKGNLDNRSKAFTRIEVDHDFGMRWDRNLTVWYVEGKMTHVAACKYAAKQLGLTEINAQCVSAATTQFDKKYSEVRAKS